MRGININNDDHFNFSNVIMLIILVIAALLIAGAKYADEHRDSPILEVTKKTSQVDTTGVGFI